MNARQMKKGLKKKIDRLQRDNVLLKDIIVNYPDMKRLYDLYNESPKNVIHTTMRFKEVRANRMMPPYMKDIKGIEEHIKEAVAKDLFEDIKGSIAYKVDTEALLKALSDMYKMADIEDIVIKSTQDGTNYRDREVTE